MIITKHRLLGLVIVVSFDKNFNNYEKIISMEKWKLFAIISMIFAGLTSVIAKFGMKNLSSDTALSIRTFVVFGIIMLNAFLFKNAYYEIKQAPKSNLIFLAISGITTSLSWFFYYRAMKEGPVSYVASCPHPYVTI